MYRPGKHNIAADTLSRAYCGATVNHAKLSELHIQLCHPGVTRLAHFVRVRNLPYSVDDVRRVCAECSQCARLKPRFYKPVQTTLIKATQPFERLSMDFKGPIPSSSKNRYMLTIVDEYSRFPFAFPCQNMNAETVIHCLLQVFSIFGTPSYIHSDRGSSFMSKELREFFNNMGIATSRTTPYNPQGNGQCERYNAIIWKNVTLALASKGLQEHQWESVLLDALHSCRSLLCTATNATPHERLFSYHRRSPSGHSLPTWLSVPGIVLLRRHIRNSKYDPLVDEVELIEANPQYAHVRYNDGRESTVSTRHLAPIGDQSSYTRQGEHPLTETVVEPPSTPIGELPIESPDVTGVGVQGGNGDSSEPPVETSDGRGCLRRVPTPAPSEHEWVRRSSRERRMPLRYRK